MPSSPPCHAPRAAARIVAAGLLGLGLCLGPPMLQAQQGGASPGAGQEQVFDIPGASLDQALTAFGHQSGLLVSVDSALTDGLESQGVRGRMAPAAALSRLLAGTGLAYQFSDSRTVTLISAPEAARREWLRPIVVTPLRVGEAEDPERFDRIDPVSRLTREQFEDLPNNRRLSDVIDRMPGVFFRGPVGVNRDIKFRGLDKDFNRFEVDGIQLPGLSGSRDFQPSRLSPLAVDVVEILRNPGAAYESDGIAGRVAVQTRPIPDELSLELDGHIGGIDTLDGTNRQLRIALGDRATPLFGYNLFVDQARTPREKDKTKTTFDEDGVFKEEEIEDEEVAEDSLNLSAELALFLEHDVLRLKPRFDRQDSSKDKTKDKIRTGRDPEREIEDEAGEDYTVGVTLDHERRLGGGMRLKSDASYFKTAEKKGKTKRVLKAGAIDKTEEEDSSVDDEFWQIRSALKVPLDVPVVQDLHLGVQARWRDRERGKTKVEIKPDGARSDKTESGDNFMVEERLLAAFVEDELFFTERFSLKPGVRVESVRRESQATGNSDATSVNTDVNPSVQLRYGIADATVLKLAVSRKVNRPKFEETVAFSKEKGDRFEVGNPDVEPAHAWNFDLELTYNTPDLLLSVLAFHKEVRNVIGLTDTGTQKDGKDVFRIENVGDGWVRGIELEQRLHMAFFSGLLDGWVLWANEGVYDSELERDDTGEKQPFDEQRDFLLNAGMDYLFPDRRTLVTIAAKYLGELEKVTGLDEIEVEENRLLLDLGLRYSVSPNVSLSFDALNVTDPDQDKKKFKDGEVTLDSETPGRVFFAGIEARF